MVIDLNDPTLLLHDDVIDDPREFYDELRRHAPVWQIPGQDTFLVLEPLLIREAVGRPDDFSSNLVSLLHDDGNGCPVAMQITNYRDPIHVLSTADPPIHTRHRRLLQAHLSPVEIAALEPKVRAFVDDYLTAASTNTRVDIVAAFSDLLPTRTVCELIGLPPDDVPWLIRTVIATGALLDGVTTPDGIGPAAESAMAISQYGHEQLRAAIERPAAERSGLLAVFCAPIDSGEVTESEVRDMLITLISAGSETTASLIATAVATLARDTEWQDELRRDPARIPDAIETILRADGPFQFHYRYVPDDTELGGVRIPARSRVLLMWAAANRPRPDAAGPADATDGRGLPPHYAFGKGLHFCIGAPIARLEARVALEALLARTRRFELAPDQPPTRRRSIFIRRHRSVHLDVDWLDID